MKQGLRRTLLATTSVLAITVGVERSAAAPCAATNPATPFTNGATINCVTMNNGATFTGDVTNAANGRIDATAGTNRPTATGISVYNATTLNGNIVNQGSIYSHGFGVFMFGSTVTGSITNNQTIASRD